MRKAFAFLFWQLRGLCEALYDDGLADWKALTIIGCLEVAVLLSLVSGIAMARGHRPVLLSKPELWMVGLGCGAVLHALNYFSLKYKNRWKRFEKEFKGYSQRTRLIGAVITSVVVIGLVTVVLWSATMARQLPR